MADVRLHDADDARGEQIGEFGAIDQPLAVASGTFE
jgi:hypothetical protein